VPVSYLTKLFHNAHLGANSTYGKIKEKIKILRNKKKTTTETRI
jgi:hypothetical protein